MGLRFAKWRAAFEVSFNEQGDLLTPSILAIDKNCEILSKYAKYCQSAHIVPIVEPELVYDGYYDISTSANLTSKILEVLFSKLAEAEVDLSGCILKTNMVIAGKKYHTPSTPNEVGIYTANVLRQNVPPELAGIVFLSGGQSVESATANLAAVIKSGPFPWPITFSFARALQDPALFAWAGNNKNADAARQAFLSRLIANTNALKP